MQIERLDHVVLTVASIEATCDWYSSVLGMQQIPFANGRIALHFGQQKINLHAIGAEADPKPPAAAPGAGDLCFITSTPIEQVVAELQALGVPILQGPVARSGAQGPIISVYVYDPDQNLIEIANYR